MPGFCPTPAAELGFVKGLLGSVDCNVHEVSAAAYGALAQSNSPMAAILTALLTLYIAVIGFQLLIGRAPLRIGDLTLSAVKIGAVIALATQWPTYQQLVFDTLFRGPEQLVASMLPALQPQGAVAGDPFGDLQLAYDQMQAAATYFSRHSLSVVSPFQGGAGLAALQLNAAGFLMLMDTLGAVLTAKIVLGLLLGLGPLFLGLLLFEATRGVFEGWLRATIGFALVPLVAVFGLVLQLSLVAPHLEVLRQTQAQNLVDFGPATAILLLTLVATMVSCALAIAVGVIAGGFRLRSFRAARVESAMAPTYAAPVGQTPLLTSRAPYAEASQPRVVTIAAAAAAMERREISEVGGAPAPRRLSVASRREDTGAGSGPPSFGRSYRRTAQPRSTSSSLRRDA